MWMGARYMAKTIIFYDYDFPIDGNRPNRSILEDLNGTIVTANSLEEALDDDKVTCFINLHGSFFPKNAWKAIYSYLTTGKGMVHFGGIPFRVPCFQEDGKWKKEREQTAYHQQLNIHEALPVKTKQVTQLQFNYDIPIFKGKEKLFAIQDTYNFILHVTKSSSLKGEMGAAGPMDARIFPLLQGLTDSGRKVAAPSVLIENRNGAFTGGRWIFINQRMDKRFWSKLGIEFLGELALFTSHGVTEISLQVNYATYEKGEQPMASLQMESFTDVPVQWEVRLTVSSNSEPLYTETVSIKASKQRYNHSFIIPITIEPGLYHVSCYIESENGEVRSLHQGFWGMDKQLLARGEPLCCDRDYFHKNGQPMPIVGMTYMTSDVARYFLFLPNAHLWDNDMAQMKRAGINYIRTGIWTGWRNMMFIDGYMDEAVLRAIDAFILCAKKHDIEVTFTFFSFTPEAWDGENPYLDSRSLKAQTRFITSIVSRHVETTNINWDLINEPSVFDPNRPFAGPKTSHDSYDRRNYQKWLKARHGTVRELRERWNVTEEELPSFAAVEPPEASEINFGIRDMMSGKKGLCWLDYTLYTMDMHNKWVKELASSIKNLAGDQLVTVGQDEALGGLRPSPLFYSEAVDYTSNHTWWFLDDLIWDGIFTKTPAKPNLIQETGIMYVENANNHAKRSEEELRNILERKYAYAFSTGGAGAVQWLWNTNYFMNNINESNIGAIRADGTEKPEANVSYDYGEFMYKIKDLFRGRKLEDIAVVYPFSNDFSNRRYSIRATTKLTRVLAYEMNMPFRAVSEYHVEEILSDLPKLLIIPSPHNFSSSTFDTILTMVKDKGVNLLFTGAISIDAYWGHTSRTESILGKTKTQNLVREEILEMNGQDYFVSFGNEKIGELLKEVDVGGKTMKEVPYGKGMIYWCGLPVELNERNEPIIALYSYVMRRSGIPEEFQWNKGNLPGMYGRKLTFKHGCLYIFVSECSKDIEIKITDQKTNTSYLFLLESERTVMYATDMKGTITAVYRPEEVEIITKN